MELDAFTVNVLVGVSTLAGGIMFLLETMLRRETRAGQIWALSFMCGMLTVISYLIWRAVPDPWVAIAVGNGALVAAMGCLWLGFRRYSGAGLKATGTVVAVLSVLEVVGTLAEGPDAGDWAGSLGLFAGVAGFALLGAVASRRGEAGRTHTTLGLTAVLIVVAVYYGARLAVFIAEGPDGATFTTWFNSSVTGTLTIVLTIVALVTATTLRNNSATQRNERDAGELRVEADGLLSRPSVALLLRILLYRWREDGRPVGVIMFRADDLAQIGTAFGALEQDALTSLCRRTVRRYAPAMSPVSSYGPTGIVTVMDADSMAAVRRTAGMIQRRMLDEIAERGSAVVPVIGVGIAMAGMAGQDAETLMRAAYDAAGRASTSSEASVMVVE